MKQRNRTYAYSLGRNALLCLTYGLYAILCQLCLILLHALQADPTVSADVLRHVFLPYLEYPLMSLTVLLGGTVLLELVAKQETP
ncbi:MAG: hypothetical protein E7668_04745 [Ruminococcaceae bacterium]|nr:hypothetical protein [Oscillospiraceae bacterium]